MEAKQPCLISTESASKRACPLVFQATQNNRTHTSLFRAHGRTRTDERKRHHLLLAGQPPQPAQLLLLLALLPTSPGISCPLPLGEPQGADGHTGTRSARVCASNWRTVATLHYRPAQTIGSRQYRHTHTQDRPGDPPRFNTTGPAAVHRV